MRMTRKRLKERHEDEYEEIRLQVEKDLYAQVMDDEAARERVVDPVLGDL
jgi:hypothetical protein